MNWKKIASIAIGIIGVLILVLTLIGKNDPVHDDLSDYVNNHIVALGKLETAAIDPYRNASGKNYKDDNTLYVTLHDTVVPKYTDFVQKLKSLAPKTSEVKSLNSRYVAGAEEQLEGFHLIMQAIEKKDAHEVTLANQKLDEGRKLVGDFLPSLDSLCKKHDIELIKNE